MAQTVGVVNSTKIGLYLGGNLITHLTDASIDISHSPRETTSKDSGGWQDFLEGIRGATLSGTAWLAEDAAYNAEDIFGLISTRASIEVKWGSLISGDYVYTVTAWLTSLSESSPGQEDNASYSISLTVTGAVVGAIVP